MPEQLEVHVFGANIGESILLRLPNRLWGLIDVHFPDLANPDSSALIRFLRERQVRDLEFFCLTHPHADHVKGALYILENFAVRRFLGFATILPAQLYNQVVKVLRLKAARLHDPSDLKEIANQLLSALALVRQRLAAGQIVSDPVVVDYQVLNAPAGPTNPSLRIRALAPSGRSLALYQEELSSCFDSRNAGTVLVDRIDGVHHNLISSGFLLEYGAQKVVLGGDIESEAWQEVLLRPAPGFDLDSDLVKVSHHGSRNGYCPRLWEDHLNRSHKAVGIVTAFSPKSLPRPAAITHLRNNARRLVTTGLSSLKPPRSPTPSRSPFASMSFDARLALDAVFRNAVLPSTLEGACSYALDGISSCAEDFHGDAGPLT